MEGGMATWEEMWHREGWKGERKGMMKEMQAEMFCFQRLSGNKQKKRTKKKRLVSQESTNPGLGSDQSGKVNILLWLNTENLNSSDKSQMAPSPWDTTGDDAEHLNNHDRNVFIIDRLKLSSNAYLQTMTVTTCRRTIFLLSCFNETGYSTSR